MGTLVPDMGVHCRDLQSVPTGCSSAPDPVLLPAFCLKPCFDEMSSSADISCSPQTPPNSPPPAIDHHTRNFGCATATTGNRPSWECRAPVRPRVLARRRAVRQDGPSKLIAKRLSMEFL